MEEGCKFKNLKKPTQPHLIGKYHMCLFQPSKAQEIQAFELVWMQRTFNARKLSLLKAA